MGSNQELPRVMPTFRAENLDQEINLQEKNMDPRKTKYTLHLFSRARQFWIEPEEGKRQALVVDLLDTQNVFTHISIPTEDVASEIANGKTVKPRRSRYEARQHMVTEHTMTVMAGVVALGEIAQDKGLLTQKDTHELLVAAMLHDLNKSREARLVSESLGDPSKGYGQAGYDQAGQEARVLLEKEGAPVEIIELSNSVGHTSCPQIDRELIEFTPITPSLLKKLILHYVDDIVTNPNIIDPTISDEGENALDRRCTQNEQNPRYVNYNLAWKNDPRRLNDEETAFQMQRRVGKRVEHFLALALWENNPSKLPQVINKRIQKKMQEVWDNNPWKLNPQNPQVK